MVRYLSLITFTNKGITDVSKSLGRADEFRLAVEFKGGRVLNQFWALGEVDGCVIFECPDDRIAASLLLHLNRQENIKTKTLRVFDTIEFESIISS